VSSDDRVSDAMVWKFLVSGIKMNHFYTGCLQRVGHDSVREPRGQREPPIMAYL